MPATTAPPLTDMAPATPLTDDQRVTLTDTLLWAFREEAEAVVEHIGAACDGDVGSARLEDCQARFAAMKRLAELLDGLPVIGWRSSYGAYREEYVAHRMAAERDTLARRAADDAEIRNTAPAGHVVIPDDMVEEMSLTATRALLQIGTNVRGMEADVDAIAAVAPDLARWTRIRDILAERESMDAADAYECWTYCSPGWVIELGAEREAAFLASLRAAGADLHLHDDQPRTSGQDDGAFPTIAVDDELLTYLRAAAAARLEQACESYHHDVATISILENRPEADECWQGHHEAYAALMSAIDDLQAVGAHRDNPNPGPLPAGLVAGLAAAATADMSYPLRENGEINDQTPVTTGVIDRLAAQAAVTRRMVVLGEQAVALVGDALDTAVTAA